MLTGLLIIASILYPIKIFLHGDCIVQKYIHLQAERANIALPKFYNIISDSLLILGTVPLFLIHILIMSKVIVRILKRRFMLNNPLRFNRSTLYQPLVGNK